MSVEETRSDREVSRILWWMLLAFPFVLPLYVIRFKIGPLPTTFLELYFGALLLVFLWQRSWVGLAEGWDRLERWRWHLVLWFGATWFAVFVGPDPLVGLGLWRAYILEPFILFVMLADVVRTEEQRRLLTRSVFLSVIPIALWALVQFVSGWGIPHPWNVSIADGRRATGPYPFPNALALYATPIGAWAFVEWLRLSRRHPDPSSSVILRNEGSSLRSDGSKILRVAQNDRIIALASWIFALVAIGCAKSDGGFLAFVVVAWVASLIDKRMRKWAISAAVLVAVVLAVVAPVRTKVWNVLTFHEWSGQVRLIMWRETWQMLKDRPILGAGLGAYPTIFKPYHKATAIEIFQYPHNVILNLWSELGLLGLFAVLAIGSSWVHEGWRRSKDPLIRASIIAPLAAITIHGLVDVPYFKNDLAMLFWIIAFLTTVPCLMKTNEPS